MSQRGAVGDVVAQRLDRRRDRVAVVDRLADVVQQGGEQELLVPRRLLLGEDVDLQTVREAVALRVAGRPLLHVREVVQQLPVDGEPGVVVRRRPGRVLVTDIPRADGPVAVHRREEVAGGVGVGEAVEFGPQFARVRQFPPADAAAVYAAGGLGEGGGGVRLLQVAEHAGRLPHDAVGPQGAAPAAGVLSVRHESAAPASGAVGWAASLRGGGGLGNLRNRRRECRCGPPDRAGRAGGTGGESPPGGGTAGAARRRDLASSMDRPRPRRPTARRGDARRRRRGAALVEFAVCLPVFTLFLAAILEINHASMVATTLRAAAQKAGRFGVVEGVTTAEVRAKALETASAAVNSDSIRVYVKDGSAFDAGAEGEAADFTTLPDAELASARPRQLFVVRLEVTYADVSLIPPFLLKGADGGPATLHGQAVNRHE